MSGRLGALTLAFAVAASVLIHASALARPGGGDLFGGDGAPSSDFGGGEGGDVDVGLVIELIALCIREPVLGGFVVLVFVGYVAVRRSWRSGLVPSWATAVPSAEVPATRTASVARSALAELRRNDPDFSAVLLEDFLYTLYAEVQHRRPRGGLTALAAFVAPGVARTLADPALEAVSGIVIGAMRLNELHVRTDRVLLGADFEANLSEVRGGNPTRSFVVDRVQFSRALGARSRPPLRVRKLDCPNCGAPLEGMHGSVCAYCRQEVGGGRLDWSIESIRRVRTERLPELFSKKVEERGTELPTRFDPSRQARLAELEARDPAFDAAAFQARVGLIFQELGAGWSGRDLSRIRPYVSDNLFQYFGYFLGIYAERRARNVTENARILRLDLASVLDDAWFDAITVRLFATSLDYTLGDDGALLHGSRTKERAYSEYWTLIRGRNAKGRARADRACPQCGAPLRVGMAGNCEYCHARVVTGDFDWVLSRIEQDEAYTG